MLCLLPVGGNQKLPSILQKCNALDDARECKHFRIWICRFGICCVFGSLADRVYRPGSFVVDSRGNLMELPKSSFISEQPDASNDVASSDDKALACNTHSIGESTSWASLANTIPSSDLYFFVGTVVDDTEWHLSLSR